MLKSNSFQSKLFLGFLVDSTYQNFLNSLNPEVKALYIQKEETYLQQYLFQNELFLGKMIEIPGNLPHLELSSQNILSLLKKIVPNYSYEHAELWLLPLIDGE
jgi:hypothetical protein